MPMVSMRQLLDEGKRSAKRLTPRLERPVRATIVCGEMAAAFIEEAIGPLKGIENLDVDLLIVKNNTLGGNVSCSGLLFGEEVAGAIQAREESGTRADMIFLPRRMFDFTGVRTLDKIRSDLDRELRRAEELFPEALVVQRASPGYQY